MQELKDLGKLSKEWYGRQARFKKWFILSFGGFLIISFLFLISLYAGLFGHIPSKRDLGNLEALQASIVYDNQGEQLGKIFEINRTYASIDTFPKHLIDALVSTEDERFYQHAGVDYRALGRVLAKGTGGGSTISQQLIKNTIGRKQRRRFGLIIEKLKEIIAAKRLEKIYSKEQILELYLNTVPFGENVYGIEAAAERFYSKHPSLLNIEEGAVLVGLLKANTTYSPRLNPEKSKERRNVVFGQMHKNQKLTDSQFDSLCALPLEIDYNFSSTNSYQPHYMRMVERQCEELLDGKKNHQGKPFSISNDGLKIYTSINVKMQAYAEEAVEEHIQVLQKQLASNWGRSRPWGKEPGLLTYAFENSRRYKRMQANGKSKEAINRAFAKPAKMSMYYPEGNRIITSSPLDSIKHLLFQLKAGFVVTENRSGNVLAYVGSPDYQFFQYDYAVARRQVASTFKPIVYAAALEKGYKPCDYYRNDKITYADYNDWAPENFDKKYGGKYSMQGALANSINVVAVDLLYKARRENVIGLARDMGITSDIPMVPSIALGVADISLLEMTRAYSSFPNDGRLAEMRLVTRIEDKNGKVLFDAGKPDDFKVMKDDNAQVMVELLKGVVDKGTARRLRSTYKLPNDIAGKTGTAQDYSDGWFIGFTKNITGGVWVGGDQRSVRFRSSKYGQGANMALPIFGLFMQKMNADTTMDPYTLAIFPELNSKLEGRLDCADFVDDNGVTRFFQSFRNKTMSDEKINRRNKGKRILKGILDVLK